MAENTVDIIVACEKECGERIKAAELKAKERVESAVRAGDELILSERKKAREQAGKMTDDANKYAERSASDDVLSGRVTFARIVTGAKEKYAAAEKVIDEILFG